MSINVYLACILLALVYAAVGKECSTDSQCEVDQCCQILSETMIVSKRRASVGSCQPYIPEGEPCDLWGRINGFCSCFPGFTCTAVEVPIENATAFVQKRKIVPPRPGYTYDIKCVKDAE